jgi:hypothetical protein
MAWTYSHSPDTSTLDWVRLVIGDTDSNDKLLSDEEINAIINKSINVWHAAYYAALLIASKFARLADESVGDVSVRYSQKSEQYYRLADKLKQEANTKSYVSAYAAGISLSDKAFNESDNDLVKSKFKIDV